MEGVRKRKISNYSKAGSKFVKTDHSGRIRKNERVKLAEDLNSSSSVGTGVNSKDIKSSEDNDWEKKNVAYVARVEKIDAITARNIMRLLCDGNTIPFLARYRKDQVGHLKADKLRKIKTSYEYIRKINSKAEHHIKQISSDEGFTTEISHLIRAAESVEELEFLVSPFKKRHIETLAQKAKAFRLDIPAKLILNGERIVQLKTYVNTEEPELNNVAAVKNKIQHVIADVISKTEDVQKLLQAIVHTGNAVLRCKARKPKPEMRTDVSFKYDAYKEFTQSVRHVKPHQVLAIFRGETEKLLSVKIDIPSAEWIPIRAYCEEKWVKSGVEYELRKSLIVDSLDDAIRRLLGPFVVRRVRAKLIKEAEEEAITVFEMNLRQRLLTPPCRGRVIIGIDPGFRYGCKVAVISQHGTPLEFAKLFLPTGPNTSERTFKSKLKDMVIRFECEMIALGNGKGSRETESLISELLRENAFDPFAVSYAVVNEEGISVYSCSPEAAEEFPDLDPVFVGAVSLARRLQDPLSELVKVEPKHLGVGLYQHDVKSSLLEVALEEIVSECVSFVGVDVNTASFHLLKRVAGLNAAKAQKVIKYREKNVAIRTLDDIKKINGIGDKTFTQCAGFLRVLPSPAGWQENPLDRTPIHPESYETARSVAECLGVSVDVLGSRNFIDRVRSELKKINSKDLVEMLNAPLTEIEFIIETFLKPVDHDIRNAFSGPVFREGVAELKDLKIGQEATGIVKNVVPFGAFVDIGVGVDGLIHSSKMNRTTLRLNDTVLVSVVSLRLSQKRIGLSLKEKISQSGKECHIEGLDFFDLAKNNMNVFENEAIELH